MRLLWYILAWITRSHDEVVEVGRMKDEARRSSKEDTQRAQFQYHYRIRTQKAHTVWFLGPTYSRLETLEHGFRIISVDSHSWQGFCWVMFQLSGLYYTSITAL